MMGFDVGKVAVVALAVLGYLSDFCSSSNSSNLSINPVQVEVVRLINQSYIVTCNGHKGEKVSWMSPKREVVADSKGRLHVESRPGMPEGAQALVFEHVAKTDKGEWSCHAENQNYTKSFKMIVNEHISFVDTPSVQQAREDKEATVRCKVTGDPTPTLSWYHNGNPIDVSNKKYQITEHGLVIKKVSLEDAGNYTCKAFQISPMASDVMDKTITVKIQHKPIAKRPLKKHATAEMAYGFMHGTVNLTCEAIAEPAANFTWHSNDGPVSKNTGRIFEDTHVSVLTIHITDQKVFQDYKCVAKNFIGTMERVISLTEGQRPKSPVEISLRGANADILDIEIKGAKAPESSSIAPRADNLPIIGYRFQYMPSPFVSNNEVPKDGNEEVISNDINVISSTTEFPEEITEEEWATAQEKDFGIEDGASFLLTGLKHNTVYVVRVYSRNAAGLSLPSAARVYRTLILQPHKVATGSGCSFTPHVFLLFALIVVQFGSIVAARRRYLRFSNK